MRFPAIRREFREMNDKYQMHLRLRELASLYSTAYPPIEISEATLDTSIHGFPNYLKTQFVRFYSRIILYAISLTKLFGYNWSY